MIEDSAVTQQELLGAWMLNSNHPVRSGDQGTLEARNMIVCLRVFPPRTTCDRCLTLTVPRQLGEAAVDQIWREMPAAHAVASSARPSGVAPSIIRRRDRSTQSRRKIGSRLTLLATVQYASPREEKKKRGLIRRAKPRAVGASSATYGDHREIARLPCSEGRRLPRLLEVAGRVVKGGVVRCGGDSRAKSKEQRATHITSFSMSCAPPHSLHTQGLAKHHSSSSSAY